MNCATDCLTAKQVELPLNYHKIKKKDTRLICFSGTVLILCFILIGVLYLVGFLVK